MGQVEPSKIYTSPLSLAGRMFAATLVSGAISGITLPMIPGALWVGPGLLFGVASALVFKVNNWLDAARSIIWVVASTAAWYLAIQSYISHAGGLTGTGISDLSNMLASGVVGAFILAVVFALLVRQASPFAIATTVLTGCALAALMYEILALRTGAEFGQGGLASYARLAAAFAVWQVGVGLTLLASKPKLAR